MAILKEKFGKFELSKEQVKAVKGGDGDNEPFIHCYMENPRSAGNGLGQLDVEVISIPNDEASINAFLEENGHLSTLIGCF
jgi:hypothetical protein